MPCLLIGLFVDCLPWLSSLPFALPPSCLRHPDPISAIDSFSVARTEIFFLLFPSLHLFLPTRTYPLPQRCHRPCRMKVNLITTYLYILLQYFFTLQVIFENIFLRKRMRAQLLPTWSLWTSGLPWRRTCGGF